MSDEPLKKSPPCKGRSLHDWGRSSVTHSDGNGRTTERTCNVCGCLRVAFASNHRFYASTVRYYAATTTGA